MASSLREQEEGKGSFKKAFLLVIPFIVFLGIKLWAISPQARSIHQGAGVGRTPETGAEDDRTEPSGPVGRSEREVRSLLT